MLYSHSELCEDKVDKDWLMGLARLICVCCRCSSSAETPRSSDMCCPRDRASEVLSLDARDRFPEE